MSYWSVVQERSGNPFVETEYDGFQQEGCGQMRTQFVGLEMKKIQFDSLVENQFPPSVETQTPYLDNKGSAVPAAEEFADAVNGKFAAPVDTEFAATADVKTAAQVNVSLDDFAAVETVAACVAPAVAVPFAAHFAVALAALAVVVAAAPVVEAFDAPEELAFHLFVSYSYELWATVLALV